MNNTPYVYVCENCGAKEQASFVNIKKDKKSGYPNMNILDMLGLGTKFIEINTSKHILPEDTNVFHEVTDLGVVFYKDPEAVYMLCSECNTGEHHGVTGKEMCKSYEYALSELSRFKFITLFDHDRDLLIEDPTSSTGYRVGTPNKPKRNTHIGSFLSGAMALAGMSMNGNYCRGPVGEDYRKLILSSMKRECKNKALTLHTIQAIRESMMSIKKFKLGR